jgi:hypothetical protein
MGDGQQNDHQATIVNGIDDAVVADAQTLEVVMSGEFDTARGTRPLRQRAYGGVDARHEGFGKMPHFPAETWCVLKRVVHVRPSSLRSLA